MGTRMHDDPDAVTISMVAEDHIARSTGACRAFDTREKELQTDPMGIVGRIDRTALLGLQHPRA